MSMPKSVRATAWMLAAALLLSSTAMAQDNGIGEDRGAYLNLGGGANFLEGFEATGVNGRTVRLNENPGPVGIVDLGYMLSYHFRGEIEFGYRDSDAKNVTLPSGGTTPTSLNLKANAMALTYMANLLYDFQPVWHLIPHVGAGVGAANVRVNNIGHDWPFAWQAMAGAEYPVTPNLKLGLEYRFLGTESLSFRATPVTLASRPNYYDHAALVTLRWNFGAPKPPPPPLATITSPPPPPPPPPAPPPARDFTIYFDTNSTTLTPAARAIVQQAAATARQAPMTRITVTGHADTVGTARYNQGLSERRAAAVQKALVAQGVPADEIAASGVGESQLAVPTAQGVNEPRNRRVVIMEAGPGS
jgi:OmpA-OmpF porin, OOP family